MKQSEDAKIKRLPVVWITGMSGSGKSTTAKEVIVQLKPSFPNIILVDGDSIREICGSDLSYTTEDRLKNAYRISRMCKFLQDQGALVVCSTISFFFEIHDWNRAHLDPYLEVLLSVELSELERRNSKGLYGEKANASNVVGVDQILQTPKAAHLTLKNHDPSDLNKNVSSIIELVRSRA